MIVKILGGGCAKCNKLEENTKIALNELRIEYQLIHVKDFAEIAKLGVMTTPALVLDEKVVLSGRVATTEEIKKLLQK